MHRGDIRIAIVLDDAPLALELGALATAEPLAVWKPEAATVTGDGRVRAPGRSVTLLRARREG